MPPKRARASSTKPAEAPTVAKPPARSRSQPPKRTSPGDGEPAPPAKRTRTATAASDESKTKTKATAAKATPKATPKAAAKPRASRAKTNTPKTNDTTKAKATPKANGTPAAKENKAISDTPAAEKPKPAPKKAAAPTEPPVNALPAAPEHSRPCAQLFGCGAGNFGQLGMGSDLLGEYSKLTRNKLIEEKIEDEEYGGEGAGLEAVAAGGMHTLFIDEKGTVWSFGVNDEGALGRVTAGVPDPNKEGQTLDVDELTAVPHPVQTLVDEKFRAVIITAGDSISAAISDAGELRVWGSFRGNQGSLGFSSDAQRQFLPTAVLDPSSITARGHEPEKFVSIAAGNNHMLVLSNNGNIYTLGAGEEGQLGRRVIERRKIHGTMPEKVVLGIRSRKAVVIGAGNNHSFAVDEAGDTWAWGLNTKGQAGTGVKDPNIDGEVHSPKKVLNLSSKELNGARVVQIAGGDHHTLFLTSEGKVYACGRSDEGQLGLGDDHPAFEDRKFPEFLPEPTVITFPDMNDPIVQVSAGTHGNMAVSEAGVLYAWGAQAQGELGLGEDETGSKTPKVIVKKEGNSWAAVKVSCGGQHSVALLRKKPKV